MLTIHMSANISVMQYVGDKTTNMDSTINNATLVSLNPDTFNVLAFRNGNNTYPGLNKDGTIRLYSGSNVLGNGSTIKIAVNYGKIDSINVDFKQGNDYCEVIVSTDTISLHNNNPAKSKQVHINSITIYYTTTDVVTDLNNTQTLDLNSPMYNLFGIPVNKSYRGIVIQNKKKFILGQN